MLQNIQGVKWVSVQKNYSSEKDTTTYTVNVLFDEKEPLNFTTTEPKDNAIQPSVIEEWASQIRAYLGVSEP